MRIGWLETLVVAPGDASPVDSDSSDSTDSADSTDSVSMVVWVFVAIGVIGYDDGSCSGSGFDSSLGLTGTTSVDVADVCCTEFSVKGVRVVVDRLFCCTITMTKTFPRLIVAAVTALDNVVLSTAGKEVDSISTPINGVV